MANAAADHLLDNYGKRIIPRGGICVHRPLPTEFSTTSPQATPTNSNGSLDAPPLDQQEEFLTFSRNMFLQTPRPVGDYSIDEIWDSDAERTFGGRLDISASGQQQHKKKSLKRKVTSVDGSADDCDSTRSSVPSSSAFGCESDGLPTVEDDVTNSCTETGKNTSMLPLCGLEDDEHMLLFLQATHRGDFQKAKLSAMVNIDRGYGKAVLKVVYVIVSFLILTLFVDHQRCSQEKGATEKAQRRMQLFRPHHLYLRIVAVETSPSKTKYARRFTCESKYKLSVLYFLMHQSERFEVH